MADTTLTVNACKRLVREKLLELGVNTRAVRIKGRTQHSSFLRTTKVFVSVHGWRAKEWRGKWEEIEKVAATNDFIVMAHGEGIIHGR